MGFAAASLVTAVASTTYSIYSGERAASEQRKGRRRTQRSEAIAQSNAARQQRENERQTARARADRPDISKLLAGEEQPVGGLGIPTGQLLLGNRKLGL
ncbi:MAG: hypothetical protein NXI31_10820 [bacterium]|nr:hypothetical protein [bacterium]